MLYTIDTTLFRVEFLGIFSFEAAWSVDADTAQVCRDAFANARDTCKTTLCHKRIVLQGGEPGVMPEDLCPS